MRVLVVDTDRRLGDILSTVLRTDGHEVLRALDGGRAREECRSQCFDVVVADLDLVRLGALDELPAPGAANAPAVILTSGRPPQDPVVRPVLSRLQARAYLKKPFSVLDLSDKLRAIADEISVGTDSLPPRKEGASGLPQRLPKHVNARNAATIARLWATRATGVLYLEGGVDGAEGTARLHEGGPVRGDHLDLLRVALHGGSVTFERKQVPGPGDWEGLGSLLYRSVRKEQLVHFADDHRFRTLIKTPWTQAVRGLPVSPAVRRIVDEADGVTPLGELIARVGVSTESVSPDLHCLRRLRLVDLQQPVHRRTRAELRREPGAAPGAPQSGSDGTDSDAWSSDLVTTPAASPAGLGERRTGRRALRSDVFQSRSETVGPVDVAKVKERLASELRRLRGAPAAVVLGVPAHAEGDLVERAAVRMRARYRALAENGSLPAEVRDLAAEVGLLVEAATHRMSIGTVQRRKSSDSMSTTGLIGRDDPSATPSTVSAISSVSEVDDVDEEKLLAWGRRFVADREWARADRVLSRAQNLRLDHPGILANLAWARFNNASRPETARLEEARDLFLLAEQFDADDGESQFLFARFLLAVGERDAALVRARRAARNRPGDHCVVSFINEAMATLDR